MAEEKDTYFTISSKPRAEIKIKGSRFIAHASTAANKEEALEFLSAVRSEFYDATHNCFAYKFGADGLEFRSSDDGEPSGSAGNPILFAINKYNFSDIIVIVTRYFGGTKLGKGGLARAYSEAAGEVLEMCSKRVVYLTKNIRVHCTYEDVSIIKRLIEEFAVSFTEDYTDSVVFEVKVTYSKVKLFTDQVVSSTQARAGFVVS